MDSYNNSIIIIIIQSIHYVC